MPSASLVALVRAEIHRLLAKLHRNGLSSAEAVVEAFSDSTYEVYLSLVPRNGQPPVNATQRPPIPAAPVLSEIESAIVEVLSSGEILTGPKIAELAGWPYETQLKTALASLRRRGIIGNRAPGYYLINPDAS